MREREPLEPLPPKRPRAGSGPQSAHSLLALQASAGNRAVTDLIRGSVQRLPMSEGRWEHVSEGTVVGTSHVTGYHWTGKGATTPVRKQANGLVEGPGPKGVYKATVESREEYGAGSKRKRLTKSKPSTFFPDAWSATRVKWAIKNAVDRGSQTAEVVNPGKRDHGMMLFHNAESAFPMDVE